jgi:hypothetical protein
MDSLIISSRRIFKILLSSVGSHINQAVDIGKGFNATGVSRVSVENIVIEVPAQQSECLSSQSCDLGIDWVKVAMVEIKVPGATGLLI